MTADEIRRLAAFPDVLRELIDQELAAGNGISGFSGGFPAPPVGDCIVLVRQVSTRSRESGNGIDFYDRNSSSYSGEFTDKKRFYFILEPPHPPPPEVDMDAIREGLRSNQDNMPGFAEERTVRAPHEVVGGFIDTMASHRPSAPDSKSTPQSTVDRFRESMVCNFDRWHDGMGYELELLQTATPEELVDIEKLLISGGVNDWRDVEALAALDSPRARVLLRQTFLNGKHELAQAVSRYAPRLVNEDERIATLVSALEHTDFYGGLTQALLEVESFHPPEIIAALMRGVLKRNGDHACHFAAMLMFLHGQSESSFDWDQRPFFLQFNTTDRAGREAMFRELCDRIGVSSAPFLTD